MQNEPRTYLAVQPSEFTSMLMVALTPCDVSGWVPQLPPLVVLACCV